jgi:O-antigen ligase
LVAALYFGVIAPDIHLKTQSVGSYSSSQARIVIWKDALHKISERPLLGTGGGTYFDKHTGQPDPNNTVLLTMAEVGIPGLTLFLVLLGSFIASARRAIRSKSSEISTLAVAATGTVVVLLFHFEVDVTWARGAASLMMAMMGLTAALWRMARDESLASDTPELEPATEREAVHV